VRATSDANRNVHAALGPPFLKEGERLPAAVDIDLDCGSDALFSHDRRYW
jgi:hypothetical protein